MGRDWWVEARGTGVLNNCLQSWHLGTCRYVYMCQAGVCDHVSESILLQRVLTFPTMSFRRLLPGWLILSARCAYCTMMGVLFRQVGDAMQMHNDECDPFDSRAQHDWKSTGNTLSQWHYMSWGCRQRDLPNIRREGSQSQVVSFGQIKYT